MTQKSRFKYDFFRKHHRYPRKIDFLKILTDHSLMFLYLFRSVEESKFFGLPINIMMRILSKKYGIEIFPKTKIGMGFYLGHAYNITINPNAILGNNINIHKGVTIGQENRGRRKGAPKIGNRVWIGVNSTIVGNISVGDNVLIAPNSYVNVDVPSDSIVIGNPCKIIQNQKATDKYIEFLV